MVTLFAAVVRRLLQWDFSWRREFVAQSAITVRRCLLPLAISASAFIIGIVVFIVAGELRSFGALDRAGNGTALGATREFGTWITGLLVAGVAGTAICADLGARKVREELDALAVIGVDTTRSLVLPRFVALAAMTPVLFAWTAFWGTAAGA